MAFLRFGNSRRPLGQKTRSTLRQENILGVIAAENGGKAPVFRSGQLELLSRYYENTQYDHLPEWRKAGSQDHHVAPRDRQPLIKYPYAKILAKRLAAKLIGHKTWPKMENKQDLEWEAYVQALTKHTFLRTHLRAPIQRMLAVGSGMIRFYLKEGAFVFESYNPNHCYPVFNADGTLKRLRIRYVFEDKQDKDADGNPKKKWFQLELTEDADILYDNPEYDRDKEPFFTVLSAAEHGLGFVQAEWFRTSYQRNLVDGESLIADVLEWIDAFNYSMSQSDHAISYNQDPQLLFSGMTEDEMGDVIRSATSSWNLGREGKAQFLESNLTGVERAESLRDKVRLNISDITRLIMHDPEKVVGHAQSAKALEILFEPMLDLIDELRPMIEPSLVSLTTKLALVNLLFAKLGEPTPVIVPKEFMPESVSLSVKWPRVFQMSIEDIRTKAQVAGQIAGASIASRQWALEWLADDVGVEDTEFEKARVDAQPVINPFGFF